MPRLFKLLFATLVLATVMFASAAPVAVADDKDSGESGPVTDPFNERLAIQVGANGRFNIGAFPDPATGAPMAGSFDLTYRWPSNPNTSYTTFRIDGADYVYGSSGALVQAPTDNGLSNTSIWRIGDLEITQTLTIVRNPHTGEDDLAEIDYTVRNLGEDAHTVEARLLIDVDRAHDDGGPFRLPDGRMEISEREFVGADVPEMFYAFWNVQNPAVAAIITRSPESVTPSRLIMASWDEMDGKVFDYAPKAGRQILTDHVYALYWPEQQIEPADQRTYESYIGLAELDFDFNASWTLGVASPAALSVRDGGYTPEPFDILAALSERGQRVADASASIELPEGLSLISSTGVLPRLGFIVGRQASWRVRVEPRTTAAVLTYSVTVTSPGTEPITVTRSVMVPATSEITFGDQSPDPGSEVEQTVDLRSFMSIAGWIKRLENRSPLTERELASLQRQLAGMSITPIVHSVAFESTGEIDWDSVRILVNGVDKTPHALVRRSTPESPSTSSGSVTLPHYWFDEDVSVRVEVANTDGVEASSDWEFSVTPKYLPGPLRGAALEKLTRLVQSYAEVIELRIDPKPIRY